MVGVRRDRGHGRTADHRDLGTQRPYTSAHLTAGRMADDWPAWSPDGTRLVFTRGDGVLHENVRLRSVLRGTPRSSALVGPGSGAAFSPDGTWIARVAEGNAAEILSELGTGRRLRIPLHGGLRNLGFLPALSWVG